MSNIFKVPSQYKNELNFFTYEHISKLEKSITKYSIEYIKNNNLSNEIKNNIELDKLYNLKYNILTNNILKIIYYLMKFQ